MTELSGASEPVETATALEPLLVVALGASAGGIKPLKEFFAHVQPHTGAAYVVVLHLSPDHESRLAEVLQTTATMPVAQVKASVRLQADHIYVIAPNTSLTMEKGVLTGTELTGAEQRRAPVNIFFRALADSYGPRAVCVVLSGSGADGSAGLKRIKEYGGFVIAQEPAEAEHFDMPRNAIATGLVDLVLPVASIPARIADYADRVRSDEQGDRPERRLTDSPDALGDVLTSLRVRTGHDFSNYKSATLLRRLDRRMSVRGVETMAQYAELVRQDPDEPAWLMKDLLISVTDFFRDAAVWNALEHRVIPRLFTGKGANDQVRVWIAGCATGEEAYSMAMLLSEYCAGLTTPPAVQVFATDLDERAIAIAREGLYSAADVAEVSEERLQRFFLRGPEGYRIRRDLRDILLFAHHNVTRDPPFSHLDLISCRNLLIYLKRGIQDRILDTFHFALRPGAFLFLGSAESADGNDQFLPFDGTSRIYASRPVASRVTPPLGETPLIRARAVPVVPDSRSPDRLMPSDLHQRLLEAYAPPSIVLSHDHRVVHMSDRAGRYLQVRGGEVSRDIMSLIHPELRPDLRTALHEAARTRFKIHVEGIGVTLDGTLHRVDLAVHPIVRDDESLQGFFLATFDERQADDEAGGGPVALTRPAEPAARQLEEELARVTEQLQSTIEQYETQVEEARASNEELQAMNEELRSAAEELETSKEELQSVNEELSTVNQELKIKIEELGLTNNDFQNFINATDIGTIFLDRSLRVKFSTPRARVVFNLLESDTGRRLSDITSRLQDDRVHEDVQAVLERLTGVEREIQTRDGRWQMMRMLPYRTSDDHIDGVVITFLDITERRLAELRVRASEERLRMLIDSTLDYAIFTVSEVGTVDSWNPGATRMFGYAADEIIGRNFSVLFTPEDRAAGMDVKELAEARRAGRAADERFHVRKDGTRFFCSGMTRPLGAGGIGFAKIARDLTAQREGAESLQQAHDQLETRVRERTRELEDSVREHEAAKQAVVTLLRRLVSAQEDERARIARDLHDHLGQQLTALRLTLERCGPQPAPGFKGEELARALTLTGQISADVDSLAWELHPAALDEFGLVAALPRFVREWSTHVGIQAEFRSRGLQPGQLTREAEVAFYRVAQEALNNVSKHAHASRVDVVLAAVEGQIVLVVEDDGQGFDAGSDGTLGSGFGLAGMRERAALIGATLDVESTPEKGTAVFLRSPIDRGRKPAESSEGPG